MNITVNFAIDGICTADEARQASEIGAAKEELRRQLYAEQFKSSVEKTVEKMVKGALAEVKKSCDHGSCACWYTVMCDDAPTRLAIKEALPHVKNILESLGYFVEDFYEYSDSWQRQSMKFGYYRIDWIKC